MKTEAHCPTCNSPFSFWRLVIGTPFSLYCFNCGWRIVVDGAAKYMWGMFVATVASALILMNFVIPRDFTRVLILGALWVFLILVFDIIISLMIVNWAHLSKPDQTVDHEEIK